MDHTLQVAQSSKRQQTSRPKRGRPAKTSGRPTKYSATLSPVPPEPCDYCVYVDHNINKVTYEQYWKDRHEMIEEYERSTEEIKKRHKFELAVHYWKYKVSSNELFNDKEFFLQVQNWQAGIPKAKETSTARKQSSATTSPPKPTPQPMPELVIESSSETHSPPTNEAKTLETEEDLGLPRLIHLPIAFKPFVSTEERYERRSRRRRWRREHPDYSYPAGPYDTSGSETEPLDQD